MSLINPAVAPGDPTSKDDGFAVGDRWVNADTGQEFVCIDNTCFRAQWLTVDHASLPEPLIPPTKSLSEQLREAGVDYLQKRNQRKQP